MTLMTSQGSRYAVPVSYSSHFHRGLAVCVWLVCAGVVATWRETTPIAWSMAAAFCAWAMLWHPGVTINRDHVRIVNPFGDTRVDVCAVEDVTTQYQYALVVGGKRFYAWGLPAPGIVGMTRATVANRNHDVLGRPQGESRAHEVGAMTRAESGGNARGGDLPSSACGAAAEVTRAMVSDAQGSTPAHEAVAHTLAWSRLAPTIVLLCFAVGASLVS